MANSKHIQWLLQGARNWNKRRQRRNFVPDFENAELFEEFRRAGKLNQGGAIPLSKYHLRTANFCGCCLHDPFSTNGVDLSKSDLSSADFKHAKMSNARLNEAILDGANFNNAYLHGAIFLGAKMASTSFVEADLSEADFTNVEFANAILKNAYLSCAKLKGADLSIAYLLGADLGWSRPWEAKLYPDRDLTLNLDPNTVDGRRVKCIGDLLEACSDLRLYYPDHVLYFRGERTNSWKLRPSVMRRSKQGVFNLRDREGEMLLELMSRRPADFNDTVSALAQWVLAQHYGLRTRLLDVTTNPLVALFAACEPDRESGLVHIFSVPKELIKPFTSDTISVICNFAKLSRADQNLLLGWSGDDIHQREGDPQFQYIHRIAMRRLYHLIR